MIQRIQTLFLLIAAGLLVSLFFNHVCYTVETAVKYTEYTPFLTFTIATSLLSVLTIFLYKTRMLQIRLCIYNILILLGFQGWIAYIFFTREPGTAFSVTAVFPLVAAILTFTALRYISRDEAMVRSANSIRRVKKNRR